MVSIVSLVVVFTFLLLLAAILNTGWVVTRKLETQNAADAAANAATVEMARGLNAVTAANHLIGELMALVVLHHGLGGYQLDFPFLPPKKTEEDVKEALEAAYDLAKELSRTPPPDPASYEAIKQDPFVGGAVGESVEQLQKVMTWAYIVHALGGALVDLKLTAPLGAVLIAAAEALEAKVDFELAIVRIFQGVATGLVPLKLSLQYGGVPLLYSYTQQAVYQAPWNADRAARAVGGEYGVEVALFPAPDPNAPAPKPFTPSFAYPGTPVPFLAGPSDAAQPVLALPVEPESLLVFPMKSQMMRATAPWMKWWRQPLLVFGKLFLTLSGFSEHYEEATDKFLLLKVYEMKLLGVNLYVLRDLYTAENLYGVLGDKGHEPWTTAEGSRRADELFSLVAFAQRPSPPILHFPIFRQANPDGLVAYAQALVYNANEQIPPILWWQLPPEFASAGTDLVGLVSQPLELLGANGTDSSLGLLSAGWEKYLALLEQPEVGWDTLNWDTRKDQGYSAVPEATVPKFSDKLDVSIPDVKEKLLGPPLPHIRLNWQAKLVPTTRLRESVSSLAGGPIGRVLGRLPPGDRSLDGTH